MRRTLAAAAVCMAAFAGCGAGDQPDISTEASEPELAAPALPSEEDFLKSGGEKLDVSGDWMSAGGGAIWANWRDTVVRVDPQTGEVTDEIPFPETACQGNGFGFGAFWTATCATDGLARIDPKTLEVTHVELPTSDFHSGNSTIGVGEGGIWLVGDDKRCQACVLIGVDPKTLEVEHEVEIEKGSASVATGLGAVWVTNPKQGTVTRVDPHTGEPISETAVQGGPQHIAVGEGAAWVFDQLEGNVIRLDAEGEEVEVVLADMAGAGGAIRTGEGSVWVRGGLTLLEEIDPETNEVVARYGPQSGGGNVLTAYGYLWVSRFDDMWEDVLRMKLPRG